MEFCTCPNCGHKFESEKKVVFETWEGRIFGKWTVKRDLGKIGANKYFECECECGTIRNISKSSLAQGKSKSCGCAKNQTKKDIIGSVIGYWTVESEAPKQGNIVYYNCKCICGVERQVSKDNLIHSKSNSCGCVRYEKQLLDGTRKNARFTKPDFSQLLTIYKAVMSHWDCEKIALTNPEYAEWLRNFDAEMIAEGKGAWIGRPNAVSPPASPE